MRARITKIEKRDDLPWWHILKVDSHPKEVLLNHNWCNHDPGGCPRAAEDVEFEVARVPVYTTVPEYDFVKGFRRVPKSSPEESVA